MLQALKYVPVSPGEESLQIFFFFKESQSLKRCPIFQQQLCGIYSSEVNYLNAHVIL
jgi:hypothetical protein